MSREWPTDQELVERAAEACRQAQEHFAEQRADDARLWLMKALYASDQLRAKHGQKRQPL